MTCETCKKQCDCKTREAYERLSKFGDVNCSGYEPATMTDNEIIKALFEMGAESESNFSNAVLDLINRQKAEIEDLKTQRRVLAFMYKEERKQRKADKTKARKEFAERLKEKKFELDDHNEDIFYVVEVADIDNLLEEMEGAE